MAGRSADVRAFVLTGPRQSEIVEFESPVPAPGEVVVDVERVGVCGTDVEFFTGEMSYLHSGLSSYPVRLGHEWSGTVSAVGDGVDPDWIGRRTTGDTHISCGHCARCGSGRHHVCEERSELGIRGRYPGALAEQLVFPARDLHPLPSSVDPTAGALVEPGGNALRSWRAASLEGGERVLIFGAGTIGILTAMFASAAGADVHILARSERSLGFARAQGFVNAWKHDELPDLPWDAVIDCSNSPGVPAEAVRLVEPARRVVLVGLAGSPSTVDTRDIALKDVTAVGILGASLGLASTIEAFASGEVNPAPLVAATVGLDKAGDVLAGWRPADAGPGPKIHIDPRR
jgi:threonine dehydrogenase-like Zn-dependent dehydrogenase